MILDVVIKKFNMRTHIEVTLLTGDKEVINLEKFDLGFSDKNGNTILIPSLRHNLGCFADNRMIIQDNLDYVLAQSNNDWFKATLKKAVKNVSVGPVIFRKDYIDKIQNDPVHLKSQDMQVYYVEETYDQLKTKFLTSTTSYACETLNLNPKIRSGFLNNDVNILDTDIDYQEDIPFMFFLDRLLITDVSVPINVQASNNNGKLRFTLQGKNEYLEYVYIVFDKINLATCTKN